MCEQLVPPACRYRFSALYVHWGETDSSSSSSAFDGGDPMGHEGRRAAGGGSEHAIAGRFFPAEIQVSMAVSNFIFCFWAERVGRGQGSIKIACRLLFLKG